MYSVQIAVSDGTLTRISLSIEYFEKDDITLYRNLELTPLVLGTDWQWDGNTAINLLTGSPVPAGEYITVRRNTNINRAFNIYDGGAAFSRETLDENFRQMIYLAQEFTEGNGLTGLFFPLDMHGFKITNLGPGTNPQDAINKAQLDIEADRISSLENTFVVGTNSYPWHTSTSTSTDTIEPPFQFNKAAVYLNGVCQTPGYSYVVVENTILLAEAVPAGTHVFCRLGEDITDATGYVPTAQYAEFVQATDDTLAAVDGRLDAVETQAADTETTVTDSVLPAVSALQTSVGALQSDKADKGATGRTQLGITTVGSSVVTASDTAAARTALGLGTLATKGPAAAVPNAAAAPTQDEFNALLASLRAGGIINT